MLNKFKSGDKVIVLDQYFIGKYEPKDLMHGEVIGKHVNSMGITGYNIVLRDFDMVIHVDEDDLAID